MKLYIHLPTNLKVFQLLVENKDFILGWNSKNEKEIAQFFLNNFPWEVMETLSSQYEANFVTMRKLKQIDKNIANNIQWIYYGSDNCEYLVPTKMEIEKALDLYEQANKKYFFKQWKRGFVLVTPYVGNAMLQRLKETLDFLNTKWNFQVVVNDLGVLRYIQKNCPNLQIIVWRIFHKLLKTPLVDTYWNHAHVSGESMKNSSAEQIAHKQQEIVANQNDFYDSLELSFKPYLKFLQKNEIARVWVDFMNKRSKMFDEKYWAEIDLYYPYACVFTWRLCDTSAIQNEERWNFATNEPCPRTCRKFDVFYKIKTVWYKLLQRWNSWFRLEQDIENLNTDFLYKQDSRLVYAPFVTV